MSQSKILKGCSPLEVLKLFGPQKLWAMELYKTCSGGTEVSVSGGSPLLCLPLPHKTGGLRRAQWDTFAPVKHPT